MLLNFKFKFKSTDGFNMSFGARDDRMNVGFANTLKLKPDEIEWYTGKYSVLPDVDHVTLETKNKLMSNDVTVFAIPLWEVSNPEGGTTIYIGGENLYG